MSSFPSLVPANVTPVTSSVVTGIEGQSIPLIFRITNDDPLVQVNNIQWELSSASGTVNITELSMTDEHYQLSEDRLSLTVSQISSAHHGTYTLFATNEAGTRSNSIILVIEGMHCKSNKDCLCTEK